MILPPLPSPSSARPNGAQEIYKCNCSTFLKTGFFHVRPADSPGDFALLSPLDEHGLKMGQGGLLDYTCFDNLIHWFFLLCLWR
jgi:hypothetical protein